MTMTNEEIARDYKQAKNGLKQAHILAELNQCGVDKIVQILQDQGVKVDGRLTQKGKPHASRRKAAAAPAAAKKATPEKKAPVPSVQKSDPINHPEHYTRGGIECIDAIMAAVKDLPAAEAWLASQVIKYVWRYKWKNGVEDLKKARFYLDRMIVETEK